MRLIDADKAMKMIEEAKVSDEKSRNFAENIIRFSKTVLENPEGATNGDMIRTMFPNWKIIEHELAFRIYPYGNDSAYFFFDKKWWNALYKAESDG